MTCLQIYTPWMWAYFWVDWPCVLARVPVLSFLGATRSFFSVNYTKWFAGLLKSSGASASSGSGGECFHAPSRRDSSGCLPNVHVCRGKKLSMPFQLWAVHRVNSFQKTKGVHSSIAARSFRATDRNRLSQMYSYCWWIPFRLELICLILIHAPDLGLPWSGSLFTAGLLGAGASQVHN